MHWRNKVWRQSIPIKIIFLLIIWLKIKIIWYFLSLTIRKIAVQFSTRKDPKVTEMPQKISANTFLYFARFQAVHVTFVHLKKGVKHEHWDDGPSMWLRWERSIQKSLRLAFLKSTFLRKQNKMRRTEVNWKIFENLIDEFLFVFFLWNKR